MKFAQRSCKTPGSWNWLQFVACGTLWIGVCLLSSMPSVIRANQEEEEEVVEVEDEDEAPVANAQRFMLAENQIEQSLFQNRTAQQAQQEMEAALNRQLDFVERAGKLSEMQKAKIKLAGRGDILRFFTTVENFKRTCPKGQVTQDEWQKVWQRIQPLQMRFNQGLNGPGSLFEKTLHSTLSREQRDKFDALCRERDRQHYLALVKLGVETIESKVPLTADQRRKLVELIMTKTEPPRVLNRQYLFYAIMIRMGKIPEDEIKPIFDEQEWKMAQQIIRQYQGMEQFLQTMEQGISEGVDIEPVNPQAKLIAR